MVKKTLQRADLPKRRCKAKKRSTGEQCGNAPIRGGTVCRFHGGAAPQVRAKAEEQLKASRDALMAALLSIALDEEHSASDRLKAITWALERAGFKGGMDVAVSITPAWQQVLEKLWSGADDAAETPAALPAAGPAALSWESETGGQFRPATSHAPELVPVNGVINGEIVRQKPAPRGLD